MSEKIILSEKLEDNKAAAEWGIRQAELIKKGEEITQRLIEKYTQILPSILSGILKYTPIILSRNIQRTISGINNNNY